MARTKHYRVAKKLAKQHDGIFIPHFAKKKFGKLLAVCAILIFVKGFLLGRLLNHK